jgi:hypothetical protein
MVTNDVRCTRNIKSRLFSPENWKFKEELSEMLYMEHSFYGA